jgi:hypothetical protein
MSTHYRPVQVSFTSINRKWCKQPKRVPVSIRIKPDMVNNQYPLMAHTVHEKKSSLKPDLIFRSTAAVDL